MASNHQPVSSKDIDSLFQVSNTTPVTSAKTKPVNTSDQRPNLLSESDDDIPPPRTSNKSNKNNKNVFNDDDDDEDDDEKEDEEDNEDSLLGRPRTNTIGGIDVEETTFATASETNNNDSETTSGENDEKQRQRQQAFNAIFDDSSLEGSANLKYVAATAENNNDDNSNSGVSKSQQNQRSGLNVFDDPYSGLLPPVNQEENSVDDHNAKIDDESRNQVEQPESPSASSPPALPEQQQQQQQEKLPHPRPHRKQFQFTSRRDFAQSSPSLGPSSPTTTTLGSPGGIGGAPRPTLMTAPVVQIPLPGLMDIFDAVEKAASADDDNTHLPLQPNVKLVVEPRYELPSALDMPLRLRCDFCLKYDSLCFHCHKKWKDIELPQRRTALLSRFADLPEGARLALFFASCARGDIEFVKIVLNAYKQAVGKWLSELVPTAVDLREGFNSNRNLLDAYSENHQHQTKVKKPSAVDYTSLSDAWDEIFIRPNTDMESLPPPKFLRPGLLKLIGRHTALHVAVAYDQLEIATLLLDFSPSLVRSEKKLMPFQLLPENPDGEEGDETPQQTENVELQVAFSTDGEPKTTATTEATNNKTEGENGTKKETVETETATDEGQQQQDPVRERLREWHKLFHSKQVISELIYANKARNLRQKKLFAEADKVYDKLLKKNPRNENALCGRAKMLFDQNRFDDCIKQCRDVLQLDMFGGVQWIDFDSSTVHYLMESALKQIHDKAHAIRGETLKTCGCVFTERIRLNLLSRVKQSFFASHICPFIDVQSSFALYNAFHGANSSTTSQTKKNNTFKRGQLGRVVIRQLQAAVSALPPATLTPLLYANAEIAAVLNQLRFQLPKENKERWHAPFTSRGFTVVAFCDFDKILVKAIVEAFNPAYKKGVFARFRKNTPELIAVVKEFEVRCVETNASNVPKKSANIGGGAAIASVVSPVVTVPATNNAESQIGVWSLIDSSDWDVDDTIQMLPQQK